MNEFSQFGSGREGRSAAAKVCSHFESMLTDAIDGTLSQEDQDAFDLHLVGCESCRTMLADARRGAAWMEMLRPYPPQPSADLVDRILGSTSLSAEAMGSQAAAESGAFVTPMLAGASSAPAAGVLAGLPVGFGSAPGKVVPFHRPLSERFHIRSVGHTLLQPRLAMTAAMAFFSIALTLNLTGVKLSQLRVSDLRPSSLKRSFSEANAHVARYYDNLRVVYELESRVHDLQKSSDEDTQVSSPAAGAAGSGTAGKTSADPGGTKNNEQPDQKPAKRRVSPGTSRRESMHGEAKVLARADADPGRQARPRSLAVLLPRVDGIGKERGLV